jgi:hypothetical protein
MLGLPAHHRFRPPRCAHELGNQELSEGRNLRWTRSSREPECKLNAPSPTPATYACARSKKAGPLWGAALLSLWLEPVELIRCLPAGEQYVPTRSFQPFQLQRRCQRRRLISRSNIKQPYHLALLARATCTPSSKRCSRARVLVKLSTKTACNARAFGTGIALTFSGGTGSLIRLRGMGSTSSSSSRRGRSRSLSSSIATKDTAPQSIRWNAAWLVAGPQQYRPGRAKPPTPSKPRALTPIPHLSMDEARNHSTPNDFCVGLRHADSRRRGPTSTQGD